jgi:hypothetical protein
MVGEKRAYGRAKVSGAVTFTYFIVLKPNSMG